MSGKNNSLSQWGCPTDIAVYSYMSLWEMCGLKREVDRFLQSVSFFRTIRHSGRGLLENRTPAVGITLGLPSILLYIL
ncbi:hypothetical protein DPMN_192715 [Dreissena polymorpha]|uniref:Uncharacterized protein n=1 Tax=Dreissena polymorpha TaxID=45954 RepID=A0A9D3Y675_DREPO|nr:hypothetical protein DPMN_192715 [Dreissena polymorpha]